MTGEMGALAPTEVVRRYLRVFETGEVECLRELVAEDVEIWGAGNHVFGLEHPMRAASTPGLTDCRMEIIGLFAAGDRVVVYFHNTYRHESTGRDVKQSGMKMYEVRDGRIVRFWGETDLFGLLVQLGKVPGEVSFD